MPLKFGHLFKPYGCNFFYTENCLSVFIIATKVSLHRSINCSILIILNILCGILLVTKLINIERTSYIYVI